MEVKPPVAIAVIVLLVVVVGYFLYKGTSGKFSAPPPPIQSGLPAGGSPLGAPGGAPGAPNPAPANGAPGATAPK